MNTTIDFGGWKEEISFISPSPSFHHLVFGLNLKEYFKEFMHMSCYDLVLRLMKIKKKINFMHTLCRYNGIDLNIWVFFCISFVAFLFDDKKD